jgi:hypothetical protein
MGKSQKQLKIKRKLKKVEKQITKDPYAEIDAEFCGISKNHQLVQDFYRALKDKKVFGLFRIRYSIRDVSPIEKRNALRAFGYVPFNGITLYNVTNDSDLIKRLKVLYSMIHLSNYDVRKWEKINHIGVINFLELYAKDYLSKKSYPIKHSVLYYQFLFGIGSAVVGLVLMFCLIYYMWGYLALITMLGLLLVYSASVTIGIYKN